MNKLPNSKIRLDSFIFSKNFSYNFKIKTASTILHIILKLKQLQQILHIILKSKQHHIFQKFYLPIILKNE